MVVAFLLLVLAVGAGALVWFWHRASEARESSRLAVQELRDAAQAKQMERSQAIEEAASARRQEVEVLTDSREDRQTLANMLNEE